MGNVMSFLGGIVALAVLGLLLFFELSREGILFVYVIYALIILVAGAMLISLREPIAGFIRALTGRASRIKSFSRGPETPKGLEGRKMEPFSGGPGQEPKGPGEVKNPALKSIMENLMERTGTRQKKSRFSGLAKRLRGIRIPRPKIRIKKPGKPKPQYRQPESKEKKGVPRKKPGKTPSERKPGISMPKIPLAKLRSLIEKAKKALKRKPGPEKPPKARPPEERREVKEKPPEEKPEKPGPGKKPVEEKLTAKPEGSCQICGSREGLRVHYIVPLDKGGTKNKDNTILLCGTHKEQAKEGMYSENLLRKLRGT